MNYALGGFHSINKQLNIAYLLMCFKTKFYLYPTLYSPVTCGTIILPCALKSYKFAEASLRTETKCFM